MHFSTLLTSYRAQPQHIHLNEDNQEAVDDNTRSMMNLSREDTRVEWTDDTYNWLNKEVA